MAAPAAAPLCRVCGEHAAEYTCPRCNARYCSLDCYKRHSDRCTEGFYRDAAVSELRSIRAGEDEQRRMADILQRLYQQEVEGGGSGSDSEEEEDEEGAGGLSVETLHRLLAKMEASGGRLDIGAEDLSPAELAAFHRALAAGELSSAVQPWQPWWLSEEAASLELSAAGTPLVAAVGDAAEQQSDQQGASSGSTAAASSSEQPPAGGAAAAAVQGSGLPPPPSRPLPPLAVLTKAAPSPLLRWQLLDLLYAYCFTLRLYNGDYAWEAADAADVLFALSAVLAATPAAAAGGAGQQSSSSGGGEDAAAGAAAVLLGCVQRACQPPVGSREGRSFAVGVLSDVAALLQLGRPVVLTALMDTCRLVEAAKQQLEGSSSSGGNVGSPPGGDGSGERGSRSKQQLKELRKRLVAAERKLLFFLSWANEQPGELYELLALAAAGEHEKHAAAVGSQAAPAAGGAAAAGLAAQLGSVSLGQAGQPAAHAGPEGGRPSAAPPVLIEEL